VAFALWGLLPVYWKALKDQAGALEIIAHRIVWSLAFTAILVRARGLWGPTLRARRERTVAEL
jgi:chloramphenicol-sensitive protein RarD